MQRRVASFARRRGARFPLAACALLALLAGCAESGVDDVLEGATAPDAGGPSGIDAPAQAADDAGSAPSVSILDTGSAASPRSDAGGVAAPAPSSQAGDAGRDASGSLSPDELGGLLDDLFGPGADAGFTPPGPTGGEWKLADGSFAECPAEPPPIPIIGGPCLGIYFDCNWTHESGATYTCVCDWVHWLCI